MPFKIGAGGHLQNYDSHGRYAKTDNRIFEPNKKSKREKARIREECRREILFNKAKKSKDKYLFDAYLAIEKEMPGEVIAVNEDRFDANQGKNREFDIITKKCIIEVKENSRRSLKQFLQQKDYAELHKKRHIVYSPDIPYGREKEFTKNGIFITKDAKTLVKAIKENKK